MFDTFCGIPEHTAGDVISIGSFKETSVEGVKASLPEAIFHVGVFPNTLTDEIKDIAFLHIDCDQQHTCREAIRLLWPRVVVGGIIAFDDYPFEGIRRAIHDNFEGRIQFTECKIPYVKKGEINE